MDNIVISFDADISKLKPAIDLLISMGQIEKSVAEQFKSTNAAYSERTGLIDKSKSSMDALSKSAADVTKNLQLGAADQQFKELGAAVDQASAKTQSFRTQLRTLREELNKLESAGLADTKQFEQVALAAAKVEHQIQKTNERLAVLASPTKNIEALVGAVQGLAAGFQLAQGAAALLGANGEDLQKTLVKIQALMAVSNGLMEINNLLFKINPTNVVAASIAQKAYTVIVGESTGALKVFKLALAGTGIGLVIIGLGYLIAQLTTAKEKTDETTDSTNKLGDAYDRLNEKFDDSFTAAEESYKSQKRAVFDLIDKYNDLIKQDETRIELARIQGATTAEISRLQLKSVSDQIAAYEKLQAKTIDLNEEDLKSYKALLEKRKVLIAQYLKDIKDQKQKEFEDIVNSAADSNEQGDKAAKAELERITGIAAIESKNASDEKLLLQDSADFAIKIGKDQFEILAEFAQSGYQTFKQFEDAKQAELTKTTQKTEEEAQKRADINKRYFKAYAELAGQLFNSAIAHDRSEITSLENKRSRGLITEREYKKQLAALKTKEAKHEKALAEFNIAISTAEAIMSILAEKDLPALVKAGLALAAGITGAIALAAVVSQPIPQFAKGTKKAPPGFKIVGEQGPELLHDNGGYQIIPNLASEKIIDHYSDPLQPLGYSMMDDAMMNNISHTGPAIDYDLLAKKVGKEVGTHIKDIAIHEFHLDADGYTEAVRKGLNRTEYLNKRNSL